jgi:hypothetical protein
MGCIAQEGKTNVYRRLVERDHCRDSDVAGSNMLKWTLCEDISCIENALFIYYDEINWKSHESVASLRVVVLWQGCFH